VIKSQLEVAAKM